VFLAWAKMHKIKHLLIERCRPMQNGYIESINGKVRDECLNEQWFTSLAQARVQIAQWRRDYKEVRPHSSCGRIPPAKFDANHRALHTNTAVPFNPGLGQQSLVRRLGQVKWSLDGLLGRGRVSGPLRVESRRYSDAVPRANRCASHNVGGLMDRACSRTPSGVFSSRIAATMSGASRVRLMCRTT
jgi:hypothetical protein